VQNTYSTQQAARRIGVSFRTLNRWLALELIQPSHTMPMGGGRTLWRWTDADVAKGRKVKAAQKPGPKAERRKAKTR
jgi:DNA-binding transcriptional MerR regulator